MTLEDKYYETWEEYDKVRRVYSETPTDETYQMMKGAEEQNNKAFAEWQSSKKVHLHGREIPEHLL